MTNDKTDELADTLHAIKDQVFHACYHMSALEERDEQAREIDELFDELVAKEEEDLRRDRVLDQLMCRQEEPDARIRRLEGIVEGLLKRM